MKIALISMHPKIGDKKTNLQTIEHYIKETPADLYIFGEMVVTGYPCKDELRSMAERRNGASIEKLKQIAKKTNSAIVCGMPLFHPSIKGLIHNSALYINKEGSLSVYDKWFLPNFGPFEEKFFFDEGEHLPIISTPFGNIGLLICYDVFFPEICKAYSLQSADILIVISASPSVTRTYFERILPARAIENTAFVLYSNIVGTQENLVFWGGSQAYDPFGNILTKAPYFKESIVTCTLDFDQLSVARAHRPVLRDTRSEIYQDLYQYARNDKKKRK